MERKRRQAINRLSALLAVAATALALGLVAVGSDRRAPHQQSGTGVPGLLKNLGVALIVVYMAIAVYALFAAGLHRSRAKTDRARSDWASLLGLVAIVLLFTLVVTKFRRRGEFQTREILESVVPASDTPPAPNVTADQPVTWGWQLGIGIVALIAVVAVVLAARNRRLRVAPPPPPDLRTLVAVSLNDVLAELEREHDPRRSVLLADRGMEVALAEHGFPRAPTETADEYSSRVADELSLSKAAAQTLTRLYSMAHFSSNALTSVDRDAAIDALRSVRDELRARPTPDLSGLDEPGVDVPVGDPGVNR